MKELKDKVKKIFNVPMLLVFILICFLFLPNAINMRSAVFRSAIVVALGIDYNDNQKYIIHAGINVSATDESLSENTKLISATGVSVGDAIANLGIQFGRPIRLGHTRFVLIGSELAKQNVATALDGIIRTNKMRDTVQLVMCDANVSEMLNIGIEIKNKTGIKMSDIIAYQSKFSTTAMDSNVDTFYKGYLSTSGISKLNCISLTDDITKGITPEAALGNANSPNAPDAGNESSSQSENSNSSSENKTSQKKFVVNNGTIALFKNGRLMKIVPPQISNGSYWINTSFMPKKLNVNVLKSKELSNAKLFFNVLNKHVNSEVFFYKNIPMMSAKINVTLGIDEIITSNNQIVPLSTDVIDQETKCAIGRQIREEVGMALEYGKKENLDLLDLNEIFYLIKYKEYKEFIKHTTTEQFFKGVQLSIEVRVEVI